MDGIVTDALYICTDCDAPLPGDPVTAPGVCHCGGAPRWADRGPEPDWLEYADLDGCAPRAADGRAV